MLPKVILVAEDNPDDAFIFRTRFKRAAMPDRLYIVDGGQRVIDLLSGKDAYSDRAKHPLPVSTCWT
ncbi:MAG TPA: hypothetical protein VM735_09310 [Candidatus Kapabacteria bacterium]|nr:hypothetical protein [Candidatus Kapabacteria bacterium]